jgi:beta-phosphoglucomutase-like phosphatase (HAD superfamily)
MLKGIIFDMDGVLINSEPFHYRIWKETLRRRGIQIEYEVYKACIGSTVGFLMKLLHEHYGVSLQDTALVEEMREIKEEMMAKEGYPPHSLCKGAAGKALRQRLSAGGSLILSLCLY